MNRTMKANWVLAVTFAGLFALVACVGPGPSKQAVLAQNQGGAQEQQKDEGGSAAKSGQSSEKSKQQHKSQQSDQKSAAAQAALDKSKEAEKLQSTFESLKQQITEAEKTLQELTTQRNKAEFRHEMKLNLAEIEQELDQVRQQMQRKIEDLQKQIDQHQQQISQIEKKREQFKQSLAQLDTSTGGEWKDVREEISSAWDELQTAYRNARQQVDGSVASARTQR